MCRPSVSLLLCVLALGACSTQDEPPATEPSASATTAEPTPSATAAATASAEPSAAAAARIGALHGGRLVAVGSHHVELKLFQRGEVEAWVLDAQGKAVAKPEALKLRLQQRGDEEQKIATSWSKPMARFTGEAAPDAGLTHADVVVELDADGERASGTLASPVLLVGPENGGVVMVAGPYGVELAVGADGSVEALVRKADGAAVEGGLALAAQVQAAGGATHTVQLAYSGKGARFVGKAKAGVKLAAGPVMLMIDGNVAAQLPRLALRAEASHGGRVVLVGDYSVELAAKGALISAFVADANAAAHAQGDLNVQLQLGAGKLVDLDWHPPSLSYQAKLAADLDLELQPVRIVIQSGGKISVGAHVSAKAAAKLKAPSADVKAKAKADGKVGIPGVKVKARAGKKGKAGAKAKVGFGF